MAWILLGSGIFVVLLCGLLFGVYRNANNIQLLRAKRPDVSLLLIVHDQAPIIEGLINELLSFCLVSPFSLELVVVDDSSQDETPEILRRLYRRHNFTLIADNLEGEDALEAGLTSCQGCTAYYVRLTGRVHLQTAVALTRCLAAGGKIPEFGVFRSWKALPGTTVH